MSPTLKRDDPAIVARIMEAEHMDDRFDKPQAASPNHASGDDQPGSVGKIDLLIDRLREADDAGATIEASALPAEPNQSQVAPLPSPVGVTICCI